MTWYRKRIAVNVDTGQHFNVFCPNSSGDDRLYPTVFFSYFSNAPTYNILSDLPVVNILDLVVNPDKEDDSEEQEEG